MAKLFTDAFFTALDSGGDPISGAKWNFYLTGTSTRQNIFTDNALTVAHANPVVADGSGRFAPIYLQALDYKAVLTDASDVTIKTIDPVHGAVINGDATVLATGTTTGTSLSDRFAAEFNIKDDGAKGDFKSATDGVTTDGSAILTSAGAAFTSDDVGKVISVAGAGTTGKTITNAANGPADQVWQEDATGPSYVDLTAAFNDATAADVVPFPASEAIGDRFIIGHAQNFSKVTITISTAGVGGVVTWKYWNGSTWTALSGVTDDTTGLTAAPGSHDLTFTVPGDWVQNIVANSKQFYIAAEITTVYSTNPVLSQGLFEGGRIRITATAHGFTNGQTTGVKNVTGTTEANGLWPITVIDADNFDLQGTVFANAYVGAGTAHGYLTTTIASFNSGTSVTMAANAGITGSSLSYNYATDDTAAILKTIARAGAASVEARVFIPVGKYLVTAVLVVPTGVQFEGQGAFSILIAGAAFPATHTSGAFTFDAPVVWFDRRTATGRFGVGGNFLIDCDNNAPVGFLGTSGANYTYQNIQTKNPVKADFVFDGMQNSQFIGLQGADSGEYNYKIINGTSLCTFIGCDANNTAKAHGFIGKDANFPSDTTWFSGVPTGNTFLGGIWEAQAPLGAIERILHMEDGNENVFIHTNFQGPVAQTITIAGIECGTASARDSFIDCLVWAKSGDEVPAIIDRGFRNRWESPNIFNWGTSTLVDLIEVYLFAEFIRPQFNTINVTGKYIANKSASVNDASRITYYPLNHAGSTANRPTEDIDTTYPYIDQSLDRIIYWDFINDIWRDEGNRKVGADNGDNNVTLTVRTDEETQPFDTTLTANRTVTLSLTNAYEGAKFRVVRTGLGAFTLDVGGLKTIPSATAAFVDVEYDNAAWILTGFGTL